MLVPKRQIEGDSQPLLYIVLVFSSRRNVTFDTRQGWVQIPGLAFARLSELRQIISSFRSSVSTTAKRRPQCLLWGWLSLCQALSVVLQMHEVPNKWKPSLPAVPSQQDSHRKDSGWSKEYAGNLCPPTQIRQERHPGQGARGEGDSLQVAWLHSAFILHRDVFQHGWPVVLLGWGHVSVGGDGLYFKGSESTSSILFTKGKMSFDTWWQVRG